MNGFKTDLTKKILGLNPHIVIESNSFKIEKSFEEKLKKKFEEISISKTFSGEGIVMNNDNAKGIIIKGISLKENQNVNFLKNNILNGNLNKFVKDTVFIGAELAFNLNLEVGDKINLMSSAFISTPFGGFPKQETLTIAGIFRTGFYEFDQNFVFLNLSDALSIFDRIVSFAGKKISYEDVISNLNILDYDYFFKVTDAILTEDVASVLNLYNEISSKGFDGDDFMLGLSEHFRNLLVCKDAATLNLLELTDGLKQRYKEQAINIKGAVIVSALNIEFEEIQV